MESFVDKKPHAVCIPFPVQSHITAMLKLAKLLYLKGFRITFVNTEFNHQKVLKSRGPDSLNGLPDFRFETIPDGLPPCDINGTQALVPLCYSMVKTFAGPLRSLIAKLNEASACSDRFQVTCVVADACLSTQVESVIQGLHIPAILLWTMSAAFLMSNLHCQQLVEEALIPPKDMAPGIRVRHTCVNLPAENGVGSSSSGDKKKGRRRSQNKKLHDFLKRGGQKPRIEILPHLERPIGLWAKEWVTELGILTRKWIPLKCHYWKDVDHKMKQVVFQRILDSFDVDFSDTHIVESVENHIQIIYRNHRAELHTFYKGLPDNVDKTLHPRDDVSQSDWAMLCAFWEADEKFQARSTVNTESRECVEVLHRGGSQSYARGLIENADPVTKEPDFFTFYKDMHYNPSKGWTAPRAEENYERMVEMSTQPTEGDSAPMTTEDIRASVLGVRYGYAPGLGYGIVPPKHVPRVTAAAAATTANRVEMEELRSRAETAENELNQLRNQHEQLREQQSIQQRQLEYILAQMGGSNGSMMDLLMGVREGADGEFYGN